MTAGGLRPRRSFKDGKIIRMLFPTHDIQHFYHKTAVIKTRQETDRVDNTAPTY